MIFLKKSLILLVFVLSTASAQIKDVNNIENNNVDVLLEKITQTKKKEENNNLIIKLFFIFIISYLLLYSLYVLVLVLIKV